MVNMGNIEDVKGLKSNLHAVFDTPQGKEVMKYLEISCGWYRSVYSPDADRDQVLINDGKRQVIATLKTIMELSPDQIVQLVGVEDAI